MDALRHLNFTSNQKANHRAVGSQWSWAFIY